MLTPTVGRIVHFYPEPNDKEARSNGLQPGEPVPALIVRVFNEGHTTVNLMVFPDCHPPVSRTSVAHEGYCPGRLSASWDWPPRVG